MSLAPVAPRLRLYLLNWSPCAQQMRSASEVLSVTQPLPSWLLSFCLT